MRSADRASGHGPHDVIENNSPITYLCDAISGEHNSNKYK